MKFINKTNYFNLTSFKDLKIMLKNNPENKIKLIAKFS